MDTQSITPNDSLNAQDSLQMNTLPVSLKAFEQYEQFIGYVLVPRVNTVGKMDKIPFNYNTAHKDNAHNPDCWMSANKAFISAELFGNEYGVGFVLTRKDPFCCIDIDNCLEISGDISTATPIDLELMRMFPKAAMEISSSGKGLHLFFSYKESAPPHIRKNPKLKIELYTEKQFIALTGIHASGDAATDYTEELHKVIDIYFPKTIAAKTNSGSIDEQWSEQVVKGVHPDWDGDREDDKLIERMLNSKSSRAIFGDKASLKDLWEGNVEALVKVYPDAGHASGYDESSADAALACHLAFWTGKDADRSLRLMKNSGLKRDKWDRDDYLIRTILNAFSIQQSVYIKSEKTQLISSFQPEPLPELPAVLPFDYSYLPDVLREYVCDISERMQCPPDYAAVAVYVMIATACGCKIGIRPMKENDWTVIPNLWGAVVGNSGMLKSPTLSECLSPLKKLAAKSLKGFNHAMTIYDAQKEVIKIQNSVNKSAARKALGKQKDLDITELLALNEVNNAPISPCVRIDVASD